MWEDCDTLRALDAEYPDLWLRPVENSEYAVAQSYDGSFSIYSDMLAAKDELLGILNIDVQWVLAFGNQLAPFPNWLANNLRPKWRLINLKGETLAAPHRANQIVMYYRKDLFTKHGIDLDFTTWETFEADVNLMQSREAVARGNPSYRAFSYKIIGSSSNTCVMLSTLLSGYGAGMIVEADGTVSINSDRAVKTLTMMRRWAGTILHPSTLLEGNDPTALLQNDETAVILYWTSLSDHFVWVNWKMEEWNIAAGPAYSNSATAKGWAMSRLGKIARVKAVHPALEMRVNHLTSLNKRPQINNREAFEAVGAFEVAAVRHVPKKMANKGWSGHWEKAGVLTGSFRPQAHYPRGWQHSGEKWKARARHDRATHRRARGGGSRHLWDPPWPWPTSSTINNPMTVKAFEMIVRWYKTLVNSRVYTASSHDHVMDEMVNDRAAVGISLTSYSSMYQWYNDNPPVAGFNLEAVPVPGPNGAGCSAHFEAAIADITDTFHEFSKSLVRDLANVLPDSVVENYNQEPVDSRVQSDPTRWQQYCELNPMLCKSIGVYPGFWSRLAHRPAAGCGVLYDSCLGAIKNVMEDLITETITPAAAAVSMEFDLNVVLGNKEDVVDVSSTEWTDTRIFLIVVCVVCGLGLIGLVGIVFARLRNLRKPSGPSLPITVFLGIVFPVLFFVVQFVVIQEWNKAFREVTEDFSKKVRQQSLELLALPISSARQSSNRGTQQSQYRKPLSRLTLPTRSSRRGTTRESSSS
ncbi:hypothetical protein DIPPA_34626 [Diplonema papillatum]|nr:hypothetical protein DIPPA_34626 [Diplonema papillatum]